MIRPFLVTGATGFLGRHVLAANAARPGARPVVALVRWMGGVSW